MKDGLSGQYFAFPKEPPSAAGRRFLDPFALTRTSWCAKINSVVCDCDPGRLSGIILFSLRTLLRHRAAGKCESSFQACAGLVINYMENLIFFAHTPYISAQLYWRHHIVNTPRLSHTLCWNFAFGDRIFPQFSSAGVTSPLLRLYKLRILHSRLAYYPIPVRPPPYILLSFKPYNKRTRKPRV